MEARFKLISKGAIKIQVPDTRQGKDHTCGASALQAVSGYFGVGPEEEEDYVADMDMENEDEGADPVDICRAAEKYGLKFIEVQPMKISQLKQYIREGKPVIMMLQAWAPDSQINYETDWDDGHWVVAIGFDKEGIYFEDPSLAAIRGFINYKDLEKRWHDIEGANKDKVDHYGLVIWQPEQQGSAYASRARFIP